MSGINGCPVCGAEPLMMVSWCDEPSPSFVSGIVEPAYAAIQCPSCGLRVMSGRFGEDGQGDAAARDAAMHDAMRRWRGLSWEDPEASNNDDNAHRKSNQV